MCLPAQMADSDAISFRYRQRCEAWRFESLGTSFTGKLLFKSGFLRLCHRRAEGRCAMRAGREDQDLRSPGKNGVNLERCGMAQHLRTARVGLQERLESRSSVAGNRAGCIDHKARRRPGGGTRVSGCGGCPGASGMAAEDGFVAPGTGRNDVDPGISADLLDAVQVGARPPAGRASQLCAPNVVPLSLSGSRRSARSA